ncbi:MAG: hypothetical protein R3F44_01275 [Candidatus Competibacteraceae bacterium]
MGLLRTLASCVWNIVAGEKLQQLSEQALTQSLYRLGRQQARVVLFLAGHGERKPLGVANHDLGTFGRELERSTFSRRRLI